MIFLHICILPKLVKITFTNIKYIKTIKHLAVSVVMQDTFAKLKNFTGQTKSSERYRTSRTTAAFGLLVSLHAQNT